MKRRVDLRIPKSTKKHRSCSPKTLHLGGSPYAAKSVSPLKLAEESYRVQEMRKIIDFCQSRLSVALCLIKNTETKLKELETPKKSKR